MPHISYIVSVYETERFLPCVLHSLRVQTDDKFEVIVTDNTKDLEMCGRIRSVVRGFDQRFKYVSTKMETCYHSAERGVELATGEYVCFPSDDSYYVPAFGETMYRQGINSAADLVICGILYDPRCGHGRYTCCPQKPERTWFDKTGFIVRRDKFIEFPNKVPTPHRTLPVTDSADGLWAEQLVAAGTRYCIMPDVLVVHN